MQTTGSWSNSDRKASDSRKRWNSRPCSSRSRRESRRTCRASAAARRSRSRAGTTRSCCRGCRGGAPGVLVDDRDVEHLEQRERDVRRSVVELGGDRDDVELDRVATRDTSRRRRRRVRSRRRRRRRHADAPPPTPTAARSFAPLVDHAERVPEVLAGVLTARQVGEVRGQPGAVGGGVVLVEAGPGDPEGQVVRHPRS